MIEDVSNWRAVAKCCATILKTKKAYLDTAEKEINIATMVAGYVD